MEVALTRAAAFHVAFATKVLFPRWAAIHCIVLAWLPRRVRPHPQLNGSYAVRRGPRRKFRFRAFVFVFVFSERKTTCRVSATTGRLGSGGMDGPCAWVQVRGEVA